MANIAGVECFQPGEWSARSYSLDDLRWAAAAVEYLGRPVPVRLGHGGEPAGTARNFRVQDGTLLADLEVSDAVTAQMRERGDYRRVSVTLEFDKRVCCETVTEVALLTREQVPAVAGLREVPLPAEEDVAVGGSA